MIFVDTSFFVALLLPKDANHSRAVHAVDALGQRRLSDALLTTNNVVLETITVARYSFDDDFSHRFVMLPASERP